MICLCGAISVDCLQKLAFWLKPTLLSMFSNIVSKKSKIVDIIDKKQPGYHYVSHTRYIMAFFMVVSTLLGMYKEMLNYF